uniref:Uncharacterized protein n=1 Tax=Arundo donax TaxID=35708 RepID=A0A0A9BRD8_ARUDO
MQFRCSMLFDLLSCQIRWEEIPL